MVGKDKASDVVPSSRSPEHVFLLFATVFGIAFIAITPPFQVPDESWHLNRAFHVAEGHVLARVENDRVGELLPKSLRTVALVYAGLPTHPERKMRSVMWKWSLSVPLDRERRVFVDLEPLGLMSPLPHLPQAAAIRIGLLFGDGPLVLLYLCRLANLMCWIALVYNAVRLAPFGRWLLVLLALAPMSLFQAASASYDAATNGAAFLGTALMLRWSLSAPATLSKGRILATAALWSMFAFLKHIYAVLSGLALLLPWASLPGRRRWVWLCVFAAAVVLPSAGWWLATAHSYIPYHLYDPAHAIEMGSRPGADPAAQAHFIRSAPLHFLNLVYHALTQGDLWAMYIARMGWLDVVFPRMFILAYGLLLVLGLVLDGERLVGFTAVRRAFTAACGAAALFAVCLGIYLQYTPVGLDHIYGLQGRYFIPAGPACLLPLCVARPLTRRPWLPFIVPHALLLSLGYAALRLVQRYYLP